jgi:hypothetical protein
MHRTGKLQLAKTYHEKIAPGLVLKLLIQNRVKIPEALLSSSS